MNFKIKSVTFVTLLLLGGVTASAQDKGRTDDTDRHSLRLTYGDGLTLGTASFWGMGLADALTGSRRSDEETAGTFGLGYRYTVNRRLRVGLDVAFAQVTGKTTLTGEQTPSIKEKELNFIVLPAVELVYYRRNLFELYGSAAAGINLTRYEENGLTPLGKQSARPDSRFGKDFAFQMNPIGLSVGNNRIAGFVEAGIGHRGFVTAGMNIRF